MKILIIGSGGFIGNTLSKFFSSDISNEVWGADILDSPAKQYFQLSPVQPAYKQVFKDNSFDVCLNASGAAHVGNSLTDPFQDYNLNVVNVFHMLDAIRQYNPLCRFLNISSAAVYGNPIALPISEEQILKPLSPYGWHKLQSELICKEFYESFGIRTCSIRVFSAYGPNLKKQLLWDIYQKVRANSSIVLYGTGNESRDFIFIDDLVDAISIILNSTVFEGESINVANGEEIFIRDLVHSFQKQMFMEFDYKFSGEERKGDPINWKADVSKLKYLGYVPKVSLDNGLQKYIEWLKEIR